MGVDMGNFANAPVIPPYVSTNGLPPRLNPLGAGLFGNRFMNAALGNVSQPPPPQQQPAAIIQMNGSMVTIRNPALHQTYASGAPITPSVPMAQNAELWNANKNGEPFTSYWPC